MTNKQLMEYHVGAILESRFGISGDKQIWRKTGEFKVCNIRDALNEAYKMGVLEGRQ